MHEDLYIDPAHPSVAMHPVPLHWRSCKPVWILLWIIASNSGVNEIFIGIGTLPLGNSMYLWLKIVSIHAQLVQNFTRFVVPENTVGVLFPELRVRSCNARLTGMNPEENKT